MSLLVVHVVAIVITAILMLALGIAWIFVQDWHVRRTPHVATEQRSEPVLPATRVIEREPCCMPGRTLAPQLMWQSLITSNDD
ncbi:MAG: hypothetical protein AAGJ40_00745 [Planctomycetota bacterium]